MPESFVKYKMPDELNPPPNPEFDAETLFKPKFKLLLVQVIP